MMLITTVGLAMLCGMFALIKANRLEDRVKKLEEKG